MRFSPEAALVLAETATILADEELRTDLLNALEAGLDVYCGEPEALAEVEEFRQASKLTGARFKRS